MGFALAHHQAAPALAHQHRAAKLIRPIKIEVLLPVHMQAVTLHQGSSAESVGLPLGLPRPPRGYWPA